MPTRARNGRKKPSPSAKAMPPGLSTPSSSGSGSGSSSAQPPSSNAHSQVPTPLEGASPLPEAPLALAEQHSSHAFEEWRGEREEREDDDERGGLIPHLIDFGDEYQAEYSAFSNHDEDGYTSFANDGYPVQRGASVEDDRDRGRYEERLEERVEERVEEDEEEEEDEAYNPDLERTYRSPPFMEAQLPPEEPPYVYPALDGGGEESDTSGTSVKSMEPLPVPPPRMSEGGRVVSEGGGRVVSPVIVSALGCSPPADGWVVLCVWFLGICVLRWGGDRS
ncbi:hypothetical protein D9611_012186 [Ephemerocybe angulata]|uniref:Uncharacterized protein n=1 Tax=Ephemerocybe angulata TaxID=980116 RepID=A0A8H5C7H0_9AGAR|nr:hypothetical protein D9611_012186 [Tulosesus angulatus]